MTWAYADQPEMTQRWQQPTSVARNLGTVIPVGLAFAAANRELADWRWLYSPDIKTFDNGQPVYEKTLKHPSLAGTYLACTVFASLTGQSPED